MFCCYNVIMPYGFNKIFDNLKRTFIIILSGPEKGRWVSNTEFIIRFDKVLLTLVLGQGKAAFLH